MLPSSSISVIRDATQHYKGVQFDSVVVFDQQLRLVGSANIHTGQELSEGLVQELHNCITKSGNSIIELDCASQHGHYHVIVNSAHDYVILYLRPSDGLIGGCDDIIE